MLVKTNKPKKLFDLKVCKQLDAIFTFNLLIWKINIWQKILTWIPIIFYIGPYMDIVHWKKFDITTYIPHKSLIVLFFIIYLITRKIISKKN